MYYFDYAATTPMRKEVLESMMPYLTTEYGNPSSQYLLGYRSFDAVNESRMVIAKSINADPDEIFFTSGGSEANSWAIKGIYVKEIITTPIEHHSLLNACGDMASAFETQINFLKTDQYGFIDLDNLKEMIDDKEALKPQLVSVMAINNELGTIEPIKKIGEICKGKAFFHVDAVQAFGHMRIDVKAMNIDMLSASGHKLYGPKGIGFLYIRKDIQKNIHPLINGGQQEQGIRGGTENVAFIVGLAKATQLAYSELDRINTKQLTLKNKLCEYVKETGGWINSPQGKNSSPSHINFRFDGIRAELWNEYFKEEQICISSGSACNSLSGEPSHVLTAIGLSEEHADESIRVSFGRDTSENDVNALIDAMNAGMDILKPQEDDTEL